MSVCHFSVSSTDATKLYYIEVMLESPGGELVPVKIPATIVPQQNSTAAAVKTIHIASSSSSSLSLAAVPASSAEVKMMNSSSSSSGVTLTTKQVGVWISRLRSFPKFRSIWLQCCDAQPVVGFFQMNSELGTAARQSGD